MVPPVLFVPKTPALAVLPLQTMRLGGTFTSPVGLTVIVSVFGVPGQSIPPLEKTGVIVRVAISNAVPLLIAVNAGIFPVPVLGNPMDGWLFVQL